MFWGSSWVQTISLERSGSWRSAERSAPWRTGTAARRGRSATEVALALASRARPCRSRSCRCTAPAAPPAPCGPGPWGSSSTNWKAPPVRSESLGRRGAEAKQALWREDHERPRLGDPRLTAEQVEVLGRGGGVGEPDVALGGEGDEALDPGARALGAGALVAVGQEKGQAGGLSPLGLPRGDEAVDDHLPGVFEVAELRLPQHEALGRGGRVAVLEAEARGLGERAVVQLERRQRPREVLDRQRT